VKKFFTDRQFIRLLVASSFFMQPSFVVLLGFRCVTHLYGR